MDPGACVLNSANGRFRLTVQEGSLRHRLGPIVVAESARVVKSRADGGHYLISTMTEFMREGMFPKSKPLLMDFFICDDYRTDEIPYRFKVCLIPVLGMVNIYRNGSPAGASDSSGVDCLRRLFRVL